VRTSVTNTLRSGVSARTAAGRVNSKDLQNPEERKIDAVQSIGAHNTLSRRAFWVPSRVAILSVLTLALVATTARAQSSSDTNPYKGFTFFEYYGGSFSSIGHVTELDTTVGYNFNKYFGVDAGIPFYFVGASKKFEIPGIMTGNGAGDVYADLLVTLANPTVNYLGTLRGTAPTGDTKIGFSTGRATFDWDNYFDHDFGDLRPFADVGLANTISDTQFFYRPFTTLGLVVLSEAGASYRVFPKIRVGASYYDDAPIGQQKVFNRLVPTVSLPNGATVGTPVTGSSAAAASEIVGPSSIDRDNGYSAWVTFQPIRPVTFLASYDHSVHYALNMFSFGIGFNMGSLYHNVRSVF
jgi:hypothetical protein